MSGVFKKIANWFNSSSGAGVVSCNQAAVKKVVEEVIKEIGLKRKVDSVDYRPKHNWYIVRFFSPPSCIIPRPHIEDYLNSGGHKGKPEIIEILSVKQKSFDLI